MSNLTKSQLEAAAAKSASVDISRENVLRFSLVRQILWGTVGGVKFGPCEALSGAGQTGVARKPVKFANWLPTKAKTGDGSGERGGAIMPGWWLVLPEQLARKQQSSFVTWGSAPTNYSLRVVPYRLESSFLGSTRNSFYIHGTGGKGSDGCILLDPTSRQVLVELVCKHGGAWLQSYISPAELNQMQEKSAKFNASA